MITPEISALHSQKETSEPARDKSADRLPYNHRAIIVVASIWLAFYLFAALHHFLSGGAGPHVAQLSNTEARFVCKTCDKHVRPNFKAAKMETAAN